MTYAEFLVRIIADGTFAAKQDYAEPAQAHKLKGSIEGFEACRSKTTTELTELLIMARKESQAAFNCASMNQITNEEYFRVRCREAEIEWVANVVSAMLVHQGKPVIVAPTARGVLKAAEILGELM